MSFDLNDAPPATTGALIPDGTFAKMAMVIRPGGIDGEQEIDRGLLKRSGNPDSDVVMLDCEFTVTEGPYARRKFWQSLTVSGGKLDASGVSIGAGITKGILRAIHDSAHGLDPADTSEAARASRILRGSRRSQRDHLRRQDQGRGEPQPGLSRPQPPRAGRRADRARVAQGHERRGGGGAVRAAPRPPPRRPAAWETPVPRAHRSGRARRDRAAAAPSPRRPPAAPPGPAWLKG